MSEAKKAAGAFLALFIAIIFTTGEPEMPNFTEKAAQTIERLYQEGRDVADGKTYSGTGMPSRIQAEIVLNKSHELYGVADLCESMGSHKSAKAARQKGYELLAESHRLSSTSRLLEEENA